MLIEADILYYHHNGSSDVWSMKILLHHLKFTSNSVLILPVSCSEARSSD